MNPEIGRKFGPYEIQGRVGGGGMGHVFRAWDARLHREVAVKLLNHEYAMPGMRERFLREARAASALNHPNICTIFDIGEQDGDPYLVMELLHGHTLKEGILERTLQLDEIVCIGREVAEALSAAHAKGVVHRDIKPANIFLVEKPNGGVQAKVLDFGLAKIEGGVLGARNRSLDITTAGATVGTLAYMSPEQARGETLDSRSDLFSLGVVLYEMATRHIPFQGATSALVFVQLLNHPPEPVRDWNESVPRELERIIFKLLAKERTHRFQTARELELELIAFQERHSSGGASWLRRTVTAVPLVRAPDPVARGRRLPESKRSSFESSSPQLSPGAQGGSLAFRDATSAERNISARTSSGMRVHSPSEQVLRPVSRLPRSESAPQNTHAPNVSAAGIASTYTAPVPATGSSTRQSMPLSEAAAETPMAVAPKADEEDDSNPASVMVTEPEAVESSGRRFYDGFDEAARDDAESPDSPRAASRWRVLTSLSPLMLLLALAVLMLLAIAIFLLTHRGRFDSAILKPVDPVLFTEVENQTGNRMLDGSIAEGLDLALRQSPYLLLRSQRSYAFALSLGAAGDEPLSVRSSAAAAAHLGAKAFYHGYIRGEGAPYTLHVDLYDTASSSVLSSFDETVASLEQVPGAMNQMAQDLRFGAGESRSSIDQTVKPLAAEASENLEALSSLRHGETLLAVGRPDEALPAMQHAVELDPHFTQAQLALASLYSGFHAEAAAAESARLSLTAAANAGDRTRSLAQAEYELEASGDLVHCIAILRGLRTLLPHDEAALEMLSEALLRSGRMTEALQVAQQASVEEPLRSSSYALAEQALLALERYDSAAELDRQVHKLGFDLGNPSVLTAFLSERKNELDGMIREDSAPSTTTRAGYRSGRNFGLYLDNTGHVDSATGLWKRRAEIARSIPGLNSTADFLLAQGSLDRALLGDCAGATGLLREASADTRNPLARLTGKVTLFNRGMTAALCGLSPEAEEACTRLQQLYPQSSAVNGYQIADIRAAAALRDLDPAAALDILRSARMYDLISLTPLLRGRAHVGLRQVQIGIVDYELVLSHRGASVIAGNTAFPAAAIGIARAYADTGDIGNSTAAYTRFVGFWQSAESTDSLGSEARRYINVHQPRL